LVVGGAEDYRSEKPRITGEKSIIQLPAGDYRLRCHIGTEDEWVPEGKLHARLEETVGTEDYRYWRKSKNAGYLGCLTVLLFPMLAYPIGWRLAVLVTLFAMVAWFYGRARFIVKRDARYQRIDKAVNEIVKRAQGNAPPTFVFELNKVTAGSGLKGGEIKL